MDPIVIPARFNGPPESANGGYAAARAAALIDGPAEVTLRAPPPLDTPLTPVAVEGGVDILHGETLVLQARARAPLPRPEHAAPPLPAAEAAAANFDADGHLLPTCFVCGPKRAEGDGLRIFAADVAGEDPPYVAAPWIPTADLAGVDGRVASEFLWAALDCPGYFALGIGMALLGRFAAAVVEAPPPGAPVIAVGWRLGSDGRKHRAATALYGADARLLAHAEATWIELKAAA